jgi:hypothetical protein
MFKVNDGLIAEKFSRLTWVECGPYPVFASYTLAFALQLRGGGNHGKTSDRVVGKLLVGNDSMCQHGRLAGSQDKGLADSQNKLSIPISLL